MKHILIFGGLGFIGSNIIDELLPEGEAYDLLVFDFPGMVNGFGSKIRMIYSDFNNADEVESVFKNNKIDIVIHLISSTIPASSNDNIIYDIEANLISSIRLLDLLVKYKIPKIVFLSSGGTVYGLTESVLVNENHPTLPISSHGVTKLSIEKYIHMFHQLYGLNYLILRVGNPYGPHQRSNKQGIINIFLRKIIQYEKLVVRGDGSAIRDYIYVKDLSYIIKLLLDFNIQNEIINIGSGQGISVNQVISILKKITPEFEVEYTEPLNSDIPKIVLDTTKVRSLVNFSLCSLDDGIFKTYNSMLSEIY